MSNQLQLGGKAVGIIPNNFEEVQRVAMALVAAGLGSNAWSDNESQKIAKATAQIMTGLELGVPPMQAMANIAIINGRPQIWGELVPALLLSAGFDFDMKTLGEGDQRYGWAWIKRPNGVEREFTFSVAQAVEAKLWDRRDKVQKKGKNGTTYEADNDSAWYKYPDDMLRWKAVARVAKVAAADVLKGIAIREDMDNRPEPIDVTPQKTAAETSNIPFDNIPSSGVEDVTDVDDDVSDDDAPTESWPLEQQAIYVESLLESLDTETDQEIIAEIIDGNAEQVAMLSPRNKVLVVSKYEELASQSAA